MKIIFLIHGLGNSSDECRVLNNFGTKYAKGRSFRERSQETTFGKKFGNKKEVNDVAQHAVYDIILH